MSFERLGLGASSLLMVRVQDSIASFLLNCDPPMESDNISWEYYTVASHGHDATNYQLISHVSNTQDQITLVSLDTILPDDLLEKIISLLPIDSIIRSGSVCKRWYDFVHLPSHSWSNMLPQKPWYFMFTCSESMGGYVYDTYRRKWYNFELPCIENRNWLSSSSRGLVCFMDSDERSRIFVGNPITRIWKRLQDAPCWNSSDYNALAMSVNQESQSYSVAVVRSKQVPDDFLHWDIYIHVYDSEAKSWVTPVNEILRGWRGGGESVICNGVLYCLIYCTHILGITEPRYGLIMYDLSTGSSCKSLMHTVIQIPYSLTCVRLMNLKERLVIVGGIGKQNRSDIIKGIGIWELQNKELQEVTRMPPRFFSGFGEFDEVFASSGSDDRIFIQSYGSPALLIFDISHKTWKWSMKCPVTKRFPLQLFTGFCFEPRLGIAS